MLSSWTNKTSGKVHKLIHNYKQYPSISGSAYLMRVGTAVDIPKKIQGTQITRGPLMSVVTTVINDRLNHTWRLYKHSEFAEITYNINSIETPGYNLISRFDTDILNKKTFYTDDSGWLITQRESVERVEESYFPSVEFTFINDTTSQLSVVTAQTHGVSSTATGSLELNMYRRLAVHGFPPLGMGEILNDTKLSVETQRIVFSESPTALSELRLDLNNPLRALFSTTRITVPVYQGIPALPKHVSVLSLKSRDCCSNQVMLRLQNLEDTPVEVKDVPQIFNSTTVVQYSLTFNDKMNSVTDLELEPYIIKALYLQNSAEQS